MGSWGDIYGAEILVNGSGGQLAAADPREVAAVTRAVVPIVAAANSIGGDVDRDGGGGTTSGSGKDKRVEGPSAKVKFYSE